MSIAEWHRECHQAFTQLVRARRQPSIEEPPQFTNNDVSNEFQKYAIWSGNLGAGHSGQTYQLSLDYRLRNASFYKSQASILVHGKISLTFLQILKLLTRLNEKVVQATTLLNSNIGLMDAGSGIGPQSFAENAIAPEAEQDSDHSSSDSSSTISDEEHRGIVAAITPGHNPTVASHRYLMLTISQECNQLFELIKHIISTLYRIPVRQPAPLDRIKGKEYVDRSLFLHFDILYVRDKFPKASNIIVERLGKAITKRRRLLQYRETHDSSLKVASHEVSTRIPEPNLPSMARHVDLGLSSASQGHPDSMTIQHEQPTQYTRATTAQEMIQALPMTQGNFAPSIPETRSSAASSFTSGMDVQYPPMPRSRDGTKQRQFECPYCFILQDIPNERAWRKHILRDVQPYTCTFDDCTLFDHIFADKESWFAHESEEHRVQFSCNTDGHPIFSSSSDFMSHMEVEHNMTTKQMHSSDALDMFKRPQNSSTGTCPLCLREAKLLRSHISRHLEQIALFALPRLLKSEENASDDAVLSLDGELSSSASDHLEDSSSSSEFSVGELPADIEGADTLPHFDFQIEPSNEDVERTTRLDTDSEHDLGDWAWMNQVDIENVELQDPEELTERLCSICEPLSLTRADFLFPRSQFKAHLRQSPRLSSVTIGTAATIRSKAAICPLCRLLTLSLDGTFAEDVETEASCFISLEINGAPFTNNQYLTRRIRASWTNITGVTMETFLTPVLEGLPNREHPSSTEEHVSFAKAWVEHCVSSHHLCQTEWVLTHEPIVMPAFSEMHILSSDAQNASLDRVREHPYYNDPDEHRRAARSDGPECEVIDLFQMCWAPLPRQAKYMVVQYDISSSDLRPDTSAIEARRIPQAFNVSWMRIPASFKLAFEVIKNIGIRYVWHEQLCLMPEDMESVIKMNFGLRDHIFECAFATFLSPGISTSSQEVKNQSEQQRYDSSLGHSEIVAPGVRLAVSQPLEKQLSSTNESIDEHLEYSIYRLLSRRCIIQVDERLYYLCRECLRSEHSSEDTAMSVSFRDPPAGLLVLDNVYSAIRRYQDFPAYQYVQFVSHLTGRYNSEQSSLWFKRLSGLLSNAFYGRFVHGLPVEYMDWALLWTPSKLLEQRSRLFESPTWTWGGWETKFSVDVTPYPAFQLLRDLGDWLRNRTWVDWHIIDEHGTPVRVAKKMDLDTWLDRRYAIPQAFLGYPRDARGERICTRPMDTKPFHIKVTKEGAEDIFKSMTIFSIEPESPLRYSPMLQFRTWSAFFKVRCQNEDIGPSGFLDFLIVDCNGADCGMIKLSPEWLDRTEMVVEFIALSDAPSSSNGAFPAWRDAPDIDPEEAPWDNYFVMLIGKIQWDYTTPGTFIRHRESIGRIEKKGFENSFPPGAAWREFILA